MNLQAEKLELVKMIIDTDDSNIIMDIKSLFKKKKVVSKENDLENFYRGFEESVREIKESIDGKIKLKDAKTWLNELPD